MTIIAVDDEPDLLERLEEEIKAYTPTAEVFAFGEVDDAVAFADENVIDIAFLDIQLGGISGIELAKKIKYKQPRCNIVFCTGYTEYATDAFQLSASDYLMKPVTAKKIKHAMENLRNPLGFNVPNGKLFMRCFGEFEVFLDGQPLHSLTSRAKELLAYIVDKRGALCSTSDILAEVFKYLADSNIRIARGNLEAVLEENGQSEILIRKWGKIGIDTDKIVCDYYEYMKGTPEAKNLYAGEYMRNYNWAKSTAEHLRQLNSQMLQGNE